ncbi:outer membrane protein [Bosea sp. (in: a-proteobacteria)]|uniref:outer membrane protein n=1 Tax=Bosea sp. (in: a-proteobacteria) TaxID=1871050 RepID=UPI002FCAAAC3
MRAASLAALTPVVAMACALTLPQAAQAADYLRGSQIEQPVEPPPLFGGGRFDWSGFYFGGFAGSSETEFEPGPGLPDLARSAFRNTALGQTVDMGQFVVDQGSKRDSGINFGGFAGYNYLFGDVVVGLEADYTRSDQEYGFRDFIARRTIAGGQVLDWSMDTRLGARLHDYATARLRMGFAYGRIMPFATIGAAFGRFDAFSTIDATAAIVTNANTATETSRMASGYPLRVGVARKDVWGFGMAFGGGIDWALTDNLFVRAEYQHVAFGDVEGTSTSVNTGRVAAALKF